MGQEQQPKHSGTRISRSKSNKQRKAGTRTSRSTLRQQSDSDDDDQEAQLISLLEQQQQHEEQHEEEQQQALIELLEADECARGEDEQTESPSCDEHRTADQQPRSAAVRADLSRLEPTKEQPEWSDSQPAAAGEAGRGDWKTDPIT